MAFKIAYCAGHYLETPGKRLPASLDKNQTREWVLNDKVARFFAQRAKDYPQVMLLRTDDETGKTFVDIPERTAKANKWGADVYLDIHHNAGINGGKGGGVEAFCYPGSTRGKAYRDAIYEQVIQAGGLKGNRARPLQEKGFDSLYLTNMPAVLMEYGFMDSITDAPIILTEDYAKKAGVATMEAIARVAGLSFTPQTDDAQTAFIRQVQKVLDTDRESLLRKTPTLSAYKNDTHPLIAVVQSRLSQLGYKQVGEADGIAGPKFTSAVKAFQKDNGCVADGEITAGNKTWKKLLAMA